MIREIVSVSFLAMTLGGAFGQPTTERIAFEVTSVKSNTSGDDAPWRYGTSRGDITATNVTLQLLIVNAYDVRHDQISGGPSWLYSERYDVVTKQGQDVQRTLAKTKQMLQTLLADRFELRLRRETKELPVYALVVGENGPNSAKPAT